MQRGDRFAKIKEEITIKKERDVIQWHPAFCSATELEFLENRKNLEFHREVNLSKKPLQMDLLIIKKLADISLINEIGHIFREHNIIEYKSPNDSMSIDDFYKTIAYACLYKATKGRQVDDIKAEEITISMFRERYPRELFQDIRTLGMVVELYQDGIYYIKGKVPFRTQIIVMNQLNQQKHESLRVLSQKLIEEDARNFLKKMEVLTEPGDRELIDSVLHVSVAANQEVYEKVKGGTIMYEAIKNLFKEEYEEIKAQTVKEAEEFKAQTVKEAEELKAQKMKEAEELKAQIIKEAEEEAKRIKEAACLFRDGK